MKHYKQQIMLLFGAIAVFSYVSIQSFSMPSEKENISVMQETKQEQIQIYVLDKENTLIPMSKEIAPGMSVEDKIKAMIEAMCEDQVQGEFSGVLGNGTAIVKIEIEEEIVRLYFNEAFSTYNKDQELRVLEALVWGATQFSDIHAVELYVHEQRLTQMPLSNTPIPETLNRKIGINHFESASSSLHKANTITVFYTKELDGSTYFVPKSKRIEGDSEDMQTVVKEVLKDVSITSNLAQPLHEDNIDIMDLPKRNGDTLEVNMNHNLLDSDRSAKQQAYEALVLSLASNFQTDKVMVFVEDNVVSLHGSNEEALHVSSLSYNPIPF